MFHPYIAQNYQPQWSNVEAKNSNKINYVYMNCIQTEKLHCCNAERERNYIYDISHDSAVLSLKYLFSVNIMSKSHGIICLTYFLEKAEYITKMSLGK